MDVNVIQWVISHYYHIYYFAAWIVPDLATRSFFKKMPLKANLTCFAEVKNEIWGGVERAFSCAFLWARMGDWVELGKGRAGVGGQGQGPGYWTDLTWYNPFSRTSFFSCLKLRVQIRSMHIKGALVSNVLILLFSYVSVLNPKLLTLSLPQKCCPLST